MINRLSEPSHEVGNAAWRPSHTVTDGFRIISKDIYNLSLIKIPMKYLPVEVLYPKKKNNAEIYRDLHKKTSL